MSNEPRITGVTPDAVIEGGRIEIHGTDLPTSGDRLPRVQVEGVDARVVFASPARVAAVVPAVTPAGEDGRARVTVEGARGEAWVRVATPLATGLHQVDSPVFDRDGNLYVTFSGTRGQQVPVSIFRVRPNGTRETFASGIVNATSMAIDPRGRLVVSSRFEGTVYRVDPDGTLTPLATDLGVACGLAFAADGTLFVGDRTGTIFRLDDQGRATPFAALPPSVAAFHLAMARDGFLYVTAPTLAPRDPVYRIAPDGTVETVTDALGRPQGLAVDAGGEVFVVEALAGSSGLYRLDEGRPRLVLSGASLVGVALSSSAMVVCTGDTAYRLQPR